MHRETEQLSVFPAFFRVAGKRVVIVGNGDEAYAKTRLLLNTQAAITVVASGPFGVRLVSSAEMQTLAA